MEKEEGLCWATYLHACPLSAGILGTSRKREALALICWVLKRNTLLSRCPQGTLDFTHFNRDLDSPPLWNGPPDPGAPQSPRLLPSTPFHSSPSCSPNFSALLLSIFQMEGDFPCVGLGLTWKAEDPAQPRRSLLKPYSLCLQSPSLRCQTPQHPVPGPHL